MRFERLEDWLHWLEGHHPTDIELGLERIRAVAERLDLLNPKAQVVTVAGTNGKGSCVTACAAMLRAAGQRVGAYTSPHLLHYSERILIDAKPVSDADLCRAFAAIDEASADISLTYFEFGTLAAFLIFRDYQVDVMVLEVGLGGRLDAVNLLDPDVAVVTSVDLDHQAWLGNDRDLIGREKAGVYRQGVVALCADPEPPQGLLDAARESGARLQLLNRDFGYRWEQPVWHWWGQGADGQLQRCVLARPELPWPSLAAALQVIALLGYAVQGLATDAQLDRCSLPGRYQRRSWRGRQLILDVAHNPAAALHLAERLAQEKVVATYLLVGMMADKDRPATLAPVLPFSDGCWLVDLPGNPRAATSAQLQQDLSGFGASPVGCGTVTQALAWLADHSQPGDRIVIMGSFFTVGAALESLDSQADSGLDRPLETSS